MLGFGNAVVYLISSQQYEPREALVSSVLVGAAHGAFSAVLFWGLWEFGLLGGISSAVPQTLAYVTLLSAPVYSASLVASRFLIGDSRFRVESVFGVIVALTQASLSVLFVCVLGFELAGAVAANVIVIVIQAVMLLMYFRKRYRPVYRLNIPFIAAGYSYGVKTWVGDLANRANLRLDQVFLSSFGQRRRHSDYTRWRFAFRS